MSRYRVNEHPFKQVIWEHKDGSEPYPTLAEIVEAAESEFLGIPLKKLQTSNPLGDITILIQTMHANL